MGPHVGILLREIFEGSPAVCLAIKEIQIQKMISLVFVYENESAIRTNAALVDSMICLLVVGISRSLEVYEVSKKKCSTKLKFRYQQLCLQHRLSGEFVT